MHSTQAADNLAPRLIPVTQWGEHFSWPTESALRSYIFNGHKNGFDRVVRRVGRRVLIDVQAFFLWIESQAGDQ